MRDNFNAILETGSLFGHDLSGQYHVIQFCLDELEERPLDEQTKRFISRIAESLDELIRLTEQARRTFRESNLDESEGRSLRDVLELASAHFHVHAAKSTPPVSVHIEGDFGVPCTCDDQLYWYLVLPTIMARIQALLKGHQSRILVLAIESDDNNFEAWRVRVKLADLQSLDLHAGALFAGEREKRFAWGIKLLKSSLKGQGKILCQEGGSELVFSQRV